MLTNLLTNFGFSRDDAIWLWGRIVGASALVVSGVFDLHYWAAYVGLNVTPTEIHIVTALATAILWISGKQSASHLPSKETVEVVQAANKP